MLETSNFVHGSAMWSLSLVMSECSLSGRGQGHLSNFYIVDLENFATISHRYTGDIHNSTVVGLFMTHCLQLNLQLHTIILVRTCRISSFCTVLHCRSVVFGITCLKKVDQTTSLLVFSALTLLVGWQLGHPSCKKTEWWGAGVVICLERGADLHMAQLIPLPLTVSCFNEIQIDFTFLVPAHLGSPVKRVVKCVCLCVCVCVCACVRACMGVSESK